MNPIFWESHQGNRSQVFQPLVLPDSVYDFSCQEWIHKMAAARIRMRLDRQRHLCCCGNSQPVPTKDICHANLQKKLRRRRHHD